MNLLSVLAGIGHPRLLVVGDLMLDEYIWGDVRRISPEAPVPVLRATRREVRLGGAASVAALLKRLEAKVALAGVVGNDAEGRAVQRLLAEEPIGCDGILSDHYRPTTSKQRFLGLAGGKHPQQILRVDQEVADPLSRAAEDGLLTRLQALLPDCDAVLISDYGKGVCTAGLLRAVITTARKQGLPVLVDPARQSPYASYRGATVIVPNRVEAELAGGHAIGNFEEAVAAGQKLLKITAAAVVIKLDRDGMVVVQPPAPIEVIRTETREVHDVTGAGDMVLAMLGLCLASGVELPQAARLANVAAGLEVQRWGVSPITREDLRGELQRHCFPKSQRGHAPLGNAPAPKIVSLDDAAAIADACRRTGRRIVFTNGCFDLLHTGHLRCLREAATLGDVLVVAVNSDASVRRLKGDERPVIGEGDRMELLAALSCVDFVLLFGDDTPSDLLRRIRPDLLVKGGTYAAEEVVGREIVRAYGGQVRVVGKVEGVSTSEILRMARSGSVPSGR